MSESARKSLREALSVQVLPGMAKGPPLQYQVIGLKEPGSSNSKGITRAFTMI
jgi:hypothetical protein